MAGRKISTSPLPPPYKGGGILVPASKSGERLDKFLISHFPQTSRHYWRDRLTATVRVNGRKPSKGRVLKGGDKIELLKSPEAPEKILPDASIPLKILYQDAYLVAVDKPAGIPCHPLRDNERGTLANALFSKFPRAAGFKAKPLEAGLIHRLDNETSGVLLFALNEAGLKRFQALNQKGAITKFYLALVQGKSHAKGEVQLPIAHHPKNKKKMVVARNPEEVRRWKARHASTEYRRVKFSGDVSLLLLRIHQGSRHQIRVHLSAIGHPILGDAIYGDKKAGPRHFLHARKVEFQHPFSGKKTSILAPLPSDFRKKIEDFS